MPDDRRIPQAEVKHPEPWQDELNPRRPEGQNVGRPSDQLERDQATTLRAVARTLEPFDAEDLRRIPVLEEGQRLQQGATYVDLAESDPHEFTASAEMIAERGHAYVPKKEVPYEIWNRLLGDERPRG